VRDGYNGLVVPPQDDAALAAAIVRYFREGLKASLRRNITSELNAGGFSWDQLVQALMQAYRQRSEA
jgi:glycosyltransferase involved in cell wall biosynthesis